MAKKRPTLISAMSKKCTLPLPPQDKTCGQSATSAVKAGGTWEWRCSSHEGILAGGGTGKVTLINPNEMKS